MKRFGCVLLLMCMFSCLIVGCGKKNSKETILIIGKKGTVSSVDVESFDKSYYTEEGFKTFATKTIDDYNRTHEEDAVTLSSFTVDGDVATLEMKFKSIKDYSEFMEVPLYQGTVVEAMSEGYPFDSSFSKVEKGEKTGKASKTDLLAEDKLHVVIINANTTVKVPGNIVYVTSDKVSITGKDTVKIKDNENDVYIIYK